MDHHWHPDQPPVVFFCKKAHHQDTFQQDQPFLSGIQYPFMTQEPFVKMRHRAVGVQGNKIHEVIFDRIGALLQIIERMADAGFPDEGYEIDKAGEIAHSFPRQRKFIIIADQERQHDDHQTIYLGKVVCGI